MAGEIVINNALLRSLKPREKVFEVRDSKLIGFILRVRPNGKMMYVCQYGRGKRINIGPANVLKLAEARDQVKNILADVLKGADPQADKKKTKAHTLESYILDIYSTWAESNHRNGHATINRLNANFLPLLGKTKLSEITPWQVEKWRSDRRKAGRRPATVNRDINALKAALQRAVDWKLIATNPLATVKPLKTDSKAIIRHLNEDEEVALRTALDAREALIKGKRDSANQWRTERDYGLMPDITGDHLKPMVIISLNTGLRRGEIFNLEWTDVNLDGSTLTVRGKGAKSGQTRYVPLNDEALNMLKRWNTQRQDNDLVFPGRNGYRFDNINNSWRKLLKKSWNN